MTRLAGAEAFPRYPITDFGAVGHACRRIKAGDCAHLFIDSVAVVAFSVRLRSPAFQ